MLVRSGQTVNMHPQHQCSWDKDPEDFSENVTVFKTAFVWGRSALQECDFHLFLLTFLSWSALPLRTKCPHWTLTPGDV